jgi:methyl-accepting chemotaxis protein
MGACFTNKIHKMGDIMNFRESFRDFFTYAKKMIIKINMVKMEKDKHKGFISNIKKIKSNLSLKKQLIIVFMLISILPVILMGIFVFSNINVQMSKSQRSMLEAYSEGVKNNINTIITDSNNILKSLSSQSDLLVLMQEVYGSGQVKEAVKLNKVIISMENAIASSEKLYETIFIADINGKVIADGSRYNNKYEKLNISNTDYFKMIKSGEDFYVGQPMKSIATEDYVIPIAAAIETKADKMGLIVIMFDLNKFTANMDNIKIGDSGFLYIVTKEGNIVYHEDKNMLLRQAQNTLISSEVSKLNKEEVIKGFKFYNENGKQSVAAYNEIESTNWLVITAMSQKEFMSSITSIGIFIFSIVVLMVFISLTVSLKYSNDVTKPIYTIGKRMKEVATGNINVYADFDENLEIKNLCNDFNEMTKNLRDLISNVVNVSKSVTTASDNFINLTTKAFESAGLVSEAIEEIASGTQEQAADVDTGVNQIEHIANNIALISEQAKVMIGASSNANMIVQSGIKEMKILNVKADESNKISQRVFNEVSELTCSIREIEAILEVIENIANQTNLLALNAAIEAAHAGELGRGFSVVAEEVKKLSQISSVKTQEISQIIKKLEDKAENVQTIVNENKIIVCEQNSVVKNTEEALNNIHCEVSKVKDIVTNISSNIGNINEEKNVMIEVVNNISIIANKTASNSDTAASAALDQFAAVKEINENCLRLNELSGDLVNSLNVFIKCI